MVAVTMATHKERASIRSDVMDEVATIMRQAAAEAILPRY
jgi:hypothetical protein